MRSRLPSYERVVEEALKVFEQYDTALTLRQLYYRLVSKRLFPNTINSYKRLSRLMVRAREEGKVPLNCLEDRSRRVLGRGDTGYASVEDFIKQRLASLRDSWKGFTMPMWDDQPHNILISLEKDALSRVVSDVANRYSIRTFPTRGYPSFTYVQRMASYIRNRLKDKPTIILYFGDFDPSGVDIERDLTDRLEKYKAGDFQVRRVALTHGQILEHQLPPMPVKKSDVRTPSFVAEYGSEAVELDALDPKMLQHMVADSVEKYIDKEVWVKRLREIEELRIWIRSRLENIEDIVLK